MRKGIGRPLLFVFLVLAGVSHADQIKQFTLVCGEGKQVAQHYEYKGGEYRFYTKSAAGDYAIREIHDPLVTFERSHANGYEFEKIKIRGKKFRSLSGEIPPGKGLMTVTFSVMTKNVEGNLRVVPRGWESVSVHSLEALFDDDGFLSLVSENKSQRRNCVLRGVN